MSWKQVAQSIVIDFLISSLILFISVQRDSQVVINFCKKKRINFKASRYIKLRQKFVILLTSYDIIILSCIRSELNLVNCLTKGLNRIKILKLSRGDEALPIKGLLIVGTQIL